MDHSDDRHAKSSHVAQRAEDVARGCGVEAARWLIEEQD